MMKILLKILVGIVILILLTKLLTFVLLEPWVKAKIETTLNEKGRVYQYEINRVRIFMLNGGMDVSGIEIFTLMNSSGEMELMGEIEAAKFRGIQIVKALFRKDFKIREIIVSDSNLKIEFNFQRESIDKIQLPDNLEVGRILFDKINLTVKNPANKATFSVKEGMLELYDISGKAQSTLSPGIIKRIEFAADELLLVSRDSMYSYIISDLNYFATTNTLVINSFKVHPNYSDYPFVSRYKFQTDRIDAEISRIAVNDFNLLEYLSSGNFKSSFLEVGEMDMKIFRDKRKEFRHKNKLALQEIIGSYPGILQIDSIALSEGSVIYKEHAEKANEAGYISFHKITARIYMITNDPYYKPESPFFKLNSNGVLMNNGVISISLEGKLFDSNNMFSLAGALSAMDAEELNPILEKNAFISVKTGKIDKMTFSFTANSVRARGKMILLYRDLDIAVINKKTDETTALKERVFSLIANELIMNSNPLPGENSREGIIDYEGDPEKSFVNFAFRSILSGVGQSLDKGPK